MGQPISALTYGTANQRTDLRDSQSERWLTGQPIRTLTYGTANQSTDLRDSQSAHWLMGQPIRALTYGTANQRTDLRDSQSAHRLTGQPIRALTYGTANQNADLRDSQWEHWWHRTTCATPCPTVRWSWRRPRRRHLGGCWRRATAALSANKRVSKMTAYPDARDCQFLGRAGHYEKIPVRTHDWRLD